MFSIISNNGTLKIPESFLIQVDQSMEGLCPVSSLPLRSVCSLGRGIMEMHPLEKREAIEGMRSVCPSLLWDSMISLLLCTWALSAHLSPITSC